MALKRNKSILLHSSGCIVAAMVLAAAIARADPAPTGPAATPTDAGAASMPAPIPCDVPVYTDHGILMAPLRPICDFLGLSIDYTDGVVTLQSKQSPPDHILVFRVGGANAQITDGAAHRNDRFPLAPEERLGNIFVPFKFTVAALGATCDGTTIAAGDRRGALSFQFAPAPPAKEAVALAVFNYTHKALSLHLDGPQKVILELGSGETVLLKIRAGHYNYWAESMGVPIHAGTRDFSTGHRATWVWGG